MDHITELDEQNDFIIQTNMDYWEDKDKRYEKANQLMTELGTSNIDPDYLVENVLRASGVMLPITIFSVGMKPQDGELDIFLTDFGQK